MSHHVLKSSLCAFAVLAAMPVSATTYRLGAHGPEIIEVGGNLNLIDGTCGSDLSNTDLHVTADDACAGAWGTGAGGDVTLPTGFQFLPNVVNDYHNLTIPEGAIIGTQYDVDGFPLPIIIRCTGTLTIAGTILASQANYQFPNSDDTNPPFDVPSHKPFDGFGSSPGSAAGGGGGGGDGALSGATAGTDGSDGSVVEKWFVGTTPGFGGPGGAANVAGSDGSQGEIGIMLSRLLADVTYSDFGRFRYYGGLPGAPADMSAWGGFGGNGGDGSGGAGGFGGSGGCAGSGGAGGGVILLAAPNVVIHSAADIEALGSDGYMGGDGQNGEDAVNTDAGGGGGGGGGPGGSGGAGGLIVVQASSYINYGAPLLINGGYGSPGGIPGMGGMGNGAGFDGAPGGFGADGSSGSDGLSVVLRCPGH